MYEQSAALDRARFKRENEAAGLDPTAKRPKTAAEAGAAASSSQPLGKFIPLQPLPFAQAVGQALKPSKPKTAKQVAQTRLRAAIDKGVATIRERNVAAASGGAVGAPAGAAAGGQIAPRPASTGLLPLADETLAADVLEVYLFVIAFGQKLQITPCADAAALAIAISLPHETPFLTELGMALVKAMLRQAEVIIHKGRQQPPPLDCALLLQQLPPTALVTPATWAETLRSLGHLLLDFGDGSGQVVVLTEALAALAGRSEVVLPPDAPDADASMGLPAGGDDGEDDGEEGGASKGVAASFAELPVAMKLALLRAMCDALLLTDEYVGECAAREEERAEKEKEIAAAEREKRRAAAVPAAAGEKSGDKGKEEGDEGGEGAKDGESRIYFIACVAPLGGGADGDKSATAVGSPAEQPAAEGGGGGGEGAAMSAEEMRRAKEQRGEATDGLIGAIEARDESMLVRAIDTAKGCHHEGVLADGRAWMSEELKHALKTLADEKRAREKAAITDAAEADGLRARAKLSKELPVREEPLGKDRNGYRYWLFGHDLAHVWVEAPAALLPAAAVAVAAPAAPAPAAMAGASAGASLKSRILAGSAAAASDGTSCATSLYASGEGEGRYIRWSWAYYEHPRHVSSLIASLSAPSEAPLRRALTQRLPLIKEAAEEAADHDGVEYEEEGVLSEAWQCGGHPLLGTRVATVHDASGRGASGGKLTAIGTITRWLPAGEDPTEDPALFHMTHVDGDGEDLEMGEVTEAVDRYAGLSDDSVSAALERSINASSVGKYENVRARRGQRVGAFGSVSLEKLKEQVCDLPRSPQISPGSHLLPRSLPSHCCSHLTATADECRGGEPWRPQEGGQRVGGRRAPRAHPVALQGV